MPAFSSTIVIPDHTEHAQRGGGPALLLIETELDLSAAASGAEWNALTMLQSKSLNVAAGSGGESDKITATLVHGRVLTAEGSTASEESEDSETLPVVILMADLYTFSIRRWTKGKRFFVVDPVLLTDAKKIVRFGFAKFQRTFTENHDYGSLNAVNATLEYVPYKSGVTPTFPALPANTDTLFTTGLTDEVKEYFGWLLGSADAAKGGFGTAVALPTTSELTAGLPSVELEF